MPTLHPTTACTMLTLIVVHSTPTTNPSTISINPLILPTGTTTSQLHVLPTSPLLLQSHSSATKRFSSPIPPSQSLPPTSSHTPPNGLLIMPNIPSTCPSMVRMHIILVPVPVAVIMCWIKYREIQII